MTDAEATARRFYDAINRHDLASAVQHLDADVVRTEPPGFPTSGTYRGRDAVAAQLAHGRGTWAEGRCDVEDVRVQGDHVVVYLHAHVRVKGATDWIDGRFADGLVLRAGLITQFHSFAERSEALAWAGIAGPV